MGKVGEVKVRGWGSILLFSVNISKIDNWLKNNKKKKNGTTKVPARCFRFVVSHTRCTRSLELHVIGVSFLKIFTYLFLSKQSNFNTYWSFYYQINSLTRASCTVLKWHCGGTKMLNPTVDLRVTWRVQCDAFLCVMCTAICFM